MDKTKKKNPLFRKIFIGACAVIVFIFGFSVFAVVINLQANSTRIPENTPSADNSLDFNVASGKILNIQGNTVFLETPSIDFKKQRLDENKKEIRKLIIDSKTEFFKQSFGLKKGKEKDGLESIVEKAIFEDLKIGNFINAVYSGNLAEVKDFSPITVIILPN